MKSPPTTAWMIQQHGRVKTWYIADTEKNLKAQVCGYKSITWQDARRRGYTCVRVSIEEERECLSVKVEQA